MSRKSINESTMRVLARLEDVKALLLDAEHLPTWNPAFTHVGPVQADRSHPVTVQKILRGQMHITESENEVHFDIAVPGLSESSTFVLTEGLDGTTRVTHQIEQTGPLVAVIGDREAALVPAKRLDRMSRVLAGTY